MRQGYLLIETHPDHPGQVRLVGLGQLPAGFPAAEPVCPGPRVRYAARFGDLDAALMHAHDALRRRLIDIDARLYGADPITAVAAVEAIDLAHRRIYLDARLVSDPALAAAIERRRRRHRRVDRIWTGIGIAAVLLLIVELALGL